MSSWKQYKRTNIGEMRPITHGECRGYHTYGILKDGNMDISISAEDLKNGSPKLGDMIARNPNNHDDKWLVAKEYFEENFEEM